MAKYQSKAQQEEQAYRQWYRQISPELEKAINAYIASYDWEKPLEDEGMKTLSPVALLQRRLAKEVVWPLVRGYETTNPGFRNRAVTESIETACKPLSEATAVKARAVQQARREALKTRPVVKEGVYRQSALPGEFVMFPAHNQVLLCISCTYLQADEDMDQFNSGYVTKFAEPNEQEMQTPEYKNARRTMEAQLAYEKALKEQMRNRDD